MTSNFLYGTFRANKRVCLDIHRFCSFDNWLYDPISEKLATYATVYRTGISLLTDCQIFMFHVNLSALSEMYVLYTSLAPNSHAFITIRNYFGISEQNFIINQPPTQLIAIRSTIDNYI